MKCEDLESRRLVTRLWPNYRPTPLTELPRSAVQAGVDRVYFKDEGRRPLGSFKSLGGTYAGLRALARATGMPTVDRLIAAKLPVSQMPMLICASDGNHGLAVAAAAEMAGVRARVFLHRHVPPQRARRIVERGAEIVWVEGTYDDAVDAARRAAEQGASLLIADTGTDPNDPIVADVMDGYSLMADEIVEQIAAQSLQGPTHLFVQAGVGGLAAALARGLRETHRLACRIVVVEPEQAACVGPAVRSGRIERLTGELRTAAEMLSCGEASTPAVDILRRVGADAMTVGEAELSAAVELWQHCGGPRTTPSGATGWAGLLTARPGTVLGKRFGIDARSRVLLIVTEAEAD